MMPGSWRELTGGRGERERETTGGEGLHDNYHGSAKCFVFSPPCCTSCSHHSGSSSASCFSSLDRLENSSSDTATWMSFNNKLTQRASLVTEHGEKIVGAVVSVPPGQQRRRVVVEHEAAPRVARVPDPGLRGAERRGPEQGVDLEVGGPLEKERVCRFNRRGEEEEERAAGYSRGSVWLAGRGGSVWSVGCRRTACSGRGEGLGGVYGDCDSAGRRQVQTTTSALFAPPGQCGGGGRRAVRTAADDT